MTDDNPYAPPLANLRSSEDVAEGAPLASRFTRFNAAIGDTLIGICYAIPIFYLLGTWTYVSEGRNPPLGPTIAGGVLGFLGFLLIRGYLLKTNGQTVGKYLAGIRIVDLNGNVPDFTKLILLRYLPISLVGLIPGVGSVMSLIDVLFIFRSDRQCVHDLLAGTKVIVNRRPS